MDQQAALKWVQRNIKNFGGNPDNMTIFGESAGGLSVNTQLASPQAAGLFDRAIVESGAYFLNTTSLADAQTAGEAAATAVGCPSHATAACLRSVPVATLLANQPANLTGNVDNKVLTQPISTALATGNFNKVPVMEGSNHDEWRLFVALDFWFATPSFPIVERGELMRPASRCRSDCRCAPPLSLAESAIPTLYPLAAYSTPSIALGAVGTDGIFACNSRLAIREMANSVPVFAYEFNDENAPELYLPPPVPGFLYGAAHASELQYIFNLPQGNLLNANQKKLSGDMVSYWAHFARFGNPNSFHTPFWPRYDLTKDQFQSLIPPQPTTEPQSGFTANHNCTLFWTPGI